MSKKRFSFEDDPSFSDFTEKDLEEWREHLLRYCELDTFAMVKVLEKLQKAAK